MEVSTRNIALYALVLAFVASSLLATPAQAKVVNCDKQSCSGTKHKDTMTGTSLSQVMVGKARGDRLTDIPKNDNDVLRGGKGNDVINSQEGHYGQNEKDVVDGGPGYDKCFVDQSSKHISDNVSNCEEVNGVVQANVNITAGAE